jgi:hypothetical protein
VTVLDAPTWKAPSTALLNLLAGTGRPGVDPSTNELALKIALPAQVSFEDGAAYVFDGGLQKCGDGDKYQPAVVEAGTAWF